MNRKMQLKQKINDNVDVCIYGLFIYKEFAAGFESASAFIKEYLKKRADFNECIGAYRISFKTNRGVLYFSDNSGMMRAYICRKQGVVTDDLENIRKGKRNFEPDYLGIAQFLYFGCAYDNRTIYKDVSITDPEKYYLIRDGKIAEKSKNLTPLHAIGRNKFDVSSLIDKVLKNTNGMDIGCTLTGGVDSRAIYATIKKGNYHPIISITGAEGHIDVRIAQEIAKKTGDEIVIISDRPDANENWISFVKNESDGMFGLCGIYRLAMQADHLEKRGILLEFGGVAGEIYKNSFINQDFPIYFGRPKWKKFYKYKVATFDFPMSLCGIEIKSKIENMEDYIIALIRNNCKKKSVAYVEAGYSILQSRFASLSFMEAKHYTAYNPLLERSMAAYGCRIHPYKLANQSFQREIVSANLPEIKDIRTDRGTTCNYNKRYFEALKGLVYLGKVYITRTLFRKKTDAREDYAFHYGLNSKEFLLAINRCKELGILGDHVSKEEIPQVLADRLFTIGSCL